MWSAVEQVYRCPAGERLELRSVTRTQRSGPERIELQQYAAAPSRCQGCALRERCTGGKGARTISRSEHEEHLEALRARMATAEAQALYKQRKQTVELANADLKTHRGLRRFSGHGVRRASTEIGLVVLRQDLLALRSSGANETLVGQPRQRPCCKQVKSWTISSGGLGSLAPAFRPERLRPQLRLWTPVRR